MKSYQRKKRPLYKSPRKSIGRSRNTVIRTRRKPYSYSRGRRSSLSGLKAILLLLLCLLMAAGLIALMVSFFQREAAWVSGDESSLASKTDSSSQSPQLSWEQTASLSTTSGDDVICENIQQPSQWNLVLVNPKIALPDSYLENSTIITAFDMEMDSRLQEPYTALYQAAVADGMNLWISSCYRSQELQAQLFQEEIEDNLRSGMSEEDAEAAAEVAVARPGYSEHNTGLAIDFNGVSMDFENTEEFRWLQEHAAEYGFVLRYPKGKEGITHIMYEPWHYRYVGKEHAEKMKELDMCLEEYLYYLQNNAG